MNPKLSAYEWSIILVFCGILTLLAGFALNRKTTPPPLPPPFVEPLKQLQVKIEGEVSHPGHYAMPLNATLKDLLERAQPLPSADLSQLKGRRKLRDGQTVRVPLKTWLTISIEGAVQKPGPFQVLSGTRVRELADQIAFLPEADIKSLSRKHRYLKAGDVIQVPVKKAKKAKLKKTKLQPHYRTKLLSLSPQRHKDTEKEPPLCLCGGEFYHA